MSEEALTGPEEPPLFLANTLNFTKGAHANVLAFSPDGQYLGTGAQDGIVEIWNHRTGKRNRDLRYQAEKQYLVMEGRLML